MLGLKGFLRPISPIEIVTVSLFCLPATAARGDVSADGTSSPEDSLVETVFSDAELSDVVLSAPDVFSGTSSPPLSSCAIVLSLFSNSTSIATSPSSAAESSPSTASISIAAASSAGASTEAISCGAAFLFLRL